MLIIGLGNPDRGDDAAGVLAARRIQERGTKAVEHKGSPLDLIEMWTANDHVTVVDAIVSGAAPGSIQVWDPLTAPLNSAAFRSSTHEFGLADTIELARALNRLSRSMRIYGIEATRFEAGTEPSEEVVSAIKRVVDEVCKSAS